MRGVESLMNGYRVSALQDEKFLEWIVGMDVQQHGLVNTIELYA